MGEANSRGALVPAPGDRLPARVEADGRHDPLASEIQRLHTEMEESREQIRRSLMSLKDGIEDQFSPRRWIEEHPLEAVGIAVATGFFFGLG